MEEREKNLRVKRRGSRTWVLLKEHIDEHHLAVHATISILSLNVQIHIRMALNIKDAQVGGKQGDEHSSESCNESSSYHQHNN